MAKYPTFVPGYDPTESTTAIERSDLNKILNEGEHADYIGPVIHASSAPNVALYPKLAYFVWHKLNVDLTATRELYVYDGTDWQWLKVPLGALTGEQIADGTITLAKLDADGLDVGHILRVGADGVEAVSFDTILANGGLSWAKFAAAAAADYIFTSIGGGSWTAVLATTYLKALFTTNASMLPHTSLFDVNNTGSQYQVLGRAAGANAGLAFAFIEALLRDNETPTRKLKFDPATHGKRVRVKVDGSDFESEDDSSNAVKVGILKYTGASGFAAQTIADSVETTVQWNNETDPDNAISGISSHVISLETGTYEVTVTVFVYTSGVTGDTRFALMWRKIDGSVIQATQTLRVDDDGDGNTLILRHVFKVTEITEDFDVRIYADDAAILGAPLNVAPYVETYQTAVIRKLA